MPRYVKVRGKPGQLVANPHIMGFNPQRFAGQKLKAIPPEYPDGLSDFYEPVEEILLWDSHLHDAINKGELVQIGRVDAPNPDVAAQKLAPAKATKGDK